MEVYPKMSSEFKVTLVPTLCVGTDHPTLPRLFSFQGVEFPKPMDFLSSASWGRIVGE